MYKYKILDVFSAISLFCRDIRESLEDVILPRVYNPCQQLLSRCWKDTPSRGSFPLEPLLPELLHHLNVGPSGRPSHGWRKKKQKIVQTLSKSAQILSKPILTCSNIVQTCLNMVLDKFQTHFTWKKKHKIEKVIKNNFSSTYRLEILRRIRFW